MEKSLGEGTEGRVVCPNNLDRTGVDTDFPERSLDTFETAIESCWEAIG